ncbi:ergosterol biosynthesis protein [Pseudocyphellaria aurata]|nr:ergosterol biosynthesis protein [Pseudocyphellaria aurata]
MALFLPPAQDGYLPYWLLLISAVSTANSVQCYLTQTYTARVYSSPLRPVNPLSGRTFGTWTFLSGVVRLYAAYHIADPLLYQLALWTYGVALAHFATEWLVFGTARWGKGLAGPVLVSTGTLAWMLTQWGWYVR